MAYIWTQLSPPTVPAARFTNRLAYDPVREEVVMFGGSDGVSFLDETWVWDGTDWTQKFPANSPSAGISSTWYSMAWDAVNNAVVLAHFKYNGVAFVSSMWLWDGTDWTDVTVSPTDPPLDNGFELCSAPGLGNVLMFGGNDGLNKTYTWDGTAWTDAAPATVPTHPRSFVGLGYDEPNARVIMFGGRDITPVIPLGDTWAWAGSDWTNLSPGGGPPSPPAREGAGLAYIGTCGKLVMFGGLGGGSSTFALLDDNWVLAPTASHPAAMSGITDLVYDEARAQGIIFGGSHLGVPSDETWTLDCDTVAAINHAFGLGR